MPHVTRVGPFGSPEGEVYFHTVLHEDGSSSGLGLDLSEALKALLALNAQWELMENASEPRTFSPDLPLPEAARSVLLQLGFTPSATPDWAHEALATTTYGMLLFTSDMIAEPPPDRDPTLRRLLAAVRNLRRLQEGPEPLPQAFRVRPAGGEDHAALVAKGEFMLAIRSKAGWLGRLGRKPGPLSAFARWPRYSIVWETLEEPLSALARPVLQAFALEQLPRPGRGVSGKTVRWEELRFITEVAEAVSAAGGSASPLQVERIPL
jgi:hypothetical protein